MTKQDCSAVLFDLDGTLLDTLADLADATNRALVALGLPAHEAERYRYFVGDGAVMLITRALPADRRDPRTIEACLAGFHKEYARNWDARTQPYAGIAKMLDEITRRGMKLAILSNKPHDFVLRCIQRFLGKWNWAVVLGQTEGIPRKPSPAGAIEVARRLDEPVGNFIYVGDTGTDMLTATAAGMFPVGVLWGFRQRDELERTGARATIEKPAELLDLIKEERG